MQLLFGKPLAERIHVEIHARVTRMAESPGLAVILVGENPASQLYVRLKEKAALSVGIRFEKYVFAEATSEGEILACVGALNQEKRVHGILVQLPLPVGLDADRIIQAIDPEKDADGFHPRNIEAFCAGDARWMPVFPMALMELLFSAGKACVGKKTSVIVNSEHFQRVMLQTCRVVGLDAVALSPQALIDDPSRVRTSEVVITACGMPGLIAAEHVMAGAIVIDGGISKQGDRVVGDVDAASVAERVSFLTPVPGGVGPVTIACLLRRTVDLAEATEN